MRGTPRRVLSSWTVSSEGRVKASMRMPLLLLLLLLLPLLGGWAFVDVMCK